MKILYSPALLALLSFFLVGVSPLAAQATTAAKVQKIPFHGTLTAVDTSAQTITLSGKSARVLHLTSATRITDGSGSPSTLSAAVVGEDVGGSYTKDASGTMTLFSVRLGAKTGTKAASTKPSPSATATPAPPPATASPATPTTAAPAKTPAATPAKAAAATAKAKKVRFSGKVVSVDAAGNTIVVHGKADQTLTVSSATKFTGATDLSGVTAGAKVSGTYTANGTTLTVDTLKVSK